MRATGSGHSFNDLADTDGTHIDLSSFDEITVNYDEMTVTIGAGVTYDMLL